MDNLQSLQNMGLSEKEASVYLALLQNGKCKAYTVAKHSGLKKPTAYFILDNLVEKGIVTKIPQARVTKYKAISPEDLFSMAEIKLNNAKKNLPELKALNKEKYFKPKISFFEGIASIKELYKKRLREMKGQEIIGFFGHNQKSSLELIEFWDIFNNERVKRKIKTKGITPKDKTTAKWVTHQKKYLLKLKAIPLENYDSSISIEIYGNEIQITSFRYLQAVVIENPDITKTLKQIFNLVWDNWRGKDKSLK